MTDDEFWRLIQRSRPGFDPARRDDSLDAQAEALRDALSNLTVEEVAAFAGTFERLHQRAYRWDLWGAAYVIGGGCSDDSFMDFRDWLISMGREVYEAALSDPDSLVAVASGPGAECCFFEGFGYVAQALLEERGVDPDSRPAVTHPRTPAGRRWQEEDLPRLYPRLWAAFDVPTGKS